MVHKINLSIPYYNDMQCHCNSSGSIDLFKLTLKDIYSHCMISDLFSLFVPFFFSIKFDRNGKKCYKLYLLQ